jgi:serine/threonine protein kinase
VLYHHQEKRLIVHPMRERCPTCGKLKNNGFVDEEYFRMLRFNSMYRYKEAEEEDLDDLEEVTNPTTSQEQHKGYYDTFFLELKKLGRGQRGSVFLVQHVLDATPLGLFAVKAIPCGHSHDWTQKMLKEVTLLTRLRHRNIVGYRHAWLEDRQLNPFVPNVPCLFILMEYANGGDLESWVMIQDKEDPITKAKRDRRQKMSDWGEALSSLPTLKTQVCGIYQVNPKVYDEGGIGFHNGQKVRFLTALEIQSFASDISRGVEHLHSLGILHRDLKPSNLLLLWDDMEPHRKGH